jgi:ketosteroid isomerase-like protein
MSAENVAIVRTLIGAFFRRDIEVMEVLQSPDVEWDATRMGGRLPGWEGIHRGPEETREFWRAWLSSWRDLQFDYEIRDAGERVVVLINNQRQWGRHSGIETEFPPYSWVYRLRDGRVIEGTFYPDQASALKDCGLAPAN